jgi:hypothetical protein
MDRVDFAFIVQHSRLPTPHNTKARVRTSTRDLHLPMLDS